MYKRQSVENYDNTIVVRDGVGRIKDLDKHNISSEAHSNEFNKKVDKITQAQRDSLGFMEPGDRIVYAVDGNLNEMPIKATTWKTKNTIVMRDINGNFQDLYDHNTCLLYTSLLLPIAGYCSLRNLISRAFYNHEGLRT